MRHGLSANLADLFQARPIEILIETRRARQRAAFHASMSLIESFGRPFRLSLPRLVGGKSRLWSGEFMLDSPTKCRLIVFDLQEIISSNRGPTGRFPLAEHGTLDQHPPLQHQHRQRFQSRLMLIGFRIDSQLSQDKAGLVVDGGEQVRGTGMSSQGGTECRSVKTDLLGQSAIQRNRVESHQQVAKAFLLGRTTGESQKMPKVHGQIVQPFHQAHVTRRSAQQAAHYRRQHGGQRMTSSITPAWIRDLRQNRQQGPRASR